MPVAKWTEEQMGMFLLNIMDEIRECTHDKCDEEPDYTWRDAFGHAFAYCHEHAREILNSGRSLTREHNQWRRIRDCR
jgi:hypothetical protein